MKILKWLSVVMLMLGLCSSQVQAQCAPGITVDIIGPALAQPSDVIDYDVTVALGADQCPITGGVVRLYLPGSSTYITVATGLALATGTTATFSNVGTYTVNIADLGTYDDGLPDLEAMEIRAYVTVVAVSQITGGTQNSGAVADWDTVVASPSIDIEKATNGDDADDPDGPIIEVGDPVTWTYVVCNDGDVPLTDIVVEDDQGVIPVYDSGDEGEAGVLEVGECWTYIAVGVAEEGQYENLACVDGYYGNVLVGDCDPSHYWGANPSIDIEKATNGEDADDPTGPIILVDDPVTWTYVVCNNGNVDLTGIVVDDDMGVTPVYVSGDEGEAGVLEVGECWTYTAVGVAEEGQYENNACVDGYYGTVLVEDCDLSHYFGANPDIDIEKATNGADADDPTGPSITVGGPVTWTYVVCNTGNVALTDIEVTDDMGVTPVYVSGDEGEAGVLEVGECWTYTATGTAELGQYENNACVDGTWLGILPDDAIDDVIVSDCDPSHYIGVEIGNTFCSWTQGFWGNAGGKSCGGQTTSELIAAALAANGGSIMVGQTGHSITFDSVECILASLPAGGKPSALPAGNFTCADLSSFYKNKKQTEINNVLVGQAVALTLNLLVADN